MYVRSCGRRVAYTSRRQPKCREADVRRCRRCGAVLRRGNRGDLCSPCARTSGRTTLPAGFYERRDVRAALAKYNFGSFFRIVRGELALTQEQFGLLVGLAQSRVSKIEGGA